MFVYALQQPDCPAMIILDLWQAHEPKVSSLIAQHINTPKTVIKKMLFSDPDPEIRKITTTTYRRWRKHE